MPEDRVHHHVAHDGDRRSGDSALVDFERRAATRVTSGPQDSRDTLWMPEGKRLIYRARTGGALVDVGPESRTESM